MSFASFQPTPAEVAFTNNIFDVADTQKLGILTGDAAVPVFAGSKLAPETLGEIWALADNDNNGFLTRKGVAVAVRLIGHAQRGENVSEALLAKPGALPEIEGIKAPASASTAPAPGSSLKSSAPFPPISPADRTKYLRLFVNSGPSGGLLSGDKARNVFLKSQLPVEKLGQIWSLADTHSRGALDATDFAIGMHLIQASMSGQLKSIPSSLPPGLYEQASAGKPPPVTPLRSQMTGGSIPLRSQVTGTPSIAPLQPQPTGGSQYSNTIQPQYTGTASPASRSFPSSISNSRNLQATAWDVTPEEKANSDRFFESLDPQNRGFIEGDVAVPFMLDSKLPEALLAQIWDLSDLNNDAKLTKEGFAVAMHLINGKLAGKEVPSVLPPNLIPPSSRGKLNGTAAPPPAPAHSTQSEIQRDLWLLDDDTPLATVLPTSPPPIPPRQAAAPIPPVTPSVPTPAPVTPAFTGNTSSPFATNLMDDDDDTDQRNALSASSMQIGNTKNQLDSTNRSLESTRAERAKLEAAVSDSAAQLSQLESQLAAAKAAHTTETKLVGDLTARHTEQSNKLRTVREELIHAESELSALRAEKAEIEGEVLRGKEEVRDLERKMKEAGEVTAQTKSELEVIKKDLRQQKGRLAIAKKQLSGAESEREKALEAVSAERKELEETNKALDELETAANAVAAAATSASPVDSMVLPTTIPLPDTPQRVASPAISTKSNNPFGRLLERSNSTASVGAAFSPFAVSSPLPEPVKEHHTGSEAFDPFGFAADTPSSPVISPTEVAASPIVNGDVAHSETSPVEINRVASPAPVAAPSAAVPSVDAPAHLVDHEPKLTVTDHSDDDSSDDDEGPESVEAAGSRFMTSSPAPISHPEPTPHAGTPLPAPEAVHAAPPALPTVASFDDAFGMSQSTSATSAFPPPSDSAFSSVGPTSSTSTEPWQPASQLSEFDAAFGGSANGSTAPAAVGGSSSEPFKFNATFDDDFDFKAASFPALTPPAEVAPGTSSTLNAAHQSDPFAPSHPNGTIPQSSPWATTTAPSTTFDDAFSIPSPSKDTPAAPAASGAPSYKPLSFDDAFSASPQLESFSPVRENAPPRPSSPLARASSPPARASSPLARATSPPRSPLAAPVSPTPRYAPPSQPPPRSRSATPEPSSPIPRPSPPPASSSNRLFGRSASTNLEPPSSSAPRTSKLGIHFPFGKNKKKQEKDKAAKKTSLEAEDRRASFAPPLPQRTASPSVIPAPPNMIGEPGPGEDIEAVKTLTGMGFSRDQAVAALERHSYDVDTALNDLLASTS